MIMAYKWKMKDYLSKPFSKSRQKHSNCMRDSNWEDLVCVQCFYECEMDMPCVDFYICGTFSARWVCKDIECKPDPSYVTHNTHIHVSYSVIVRLVHNYKLLSNFSGYEKDPWKERHIKETYIAPYISDFSTDRN